jgi:hypothetical protein
MMDEKLASDAPQEEMGKEKDDGQVNLYKLGGQSHCEETHHKVSC